MGHSILQRVGPLFFLISNWTEVSGSFHRIRPADTPPNTTKPTIFPHSTQEESPSTTKEYGSRVRAHIEIQNNEVVTTLRCDDTMMSRRNASMISMRGLEINIRIQRKSSAIRNYTNYYGF